MSVRRRTSPNLAGHLADVFANKCDRADWSPLETVALALDRALVIFDCRLRESSTISTHHIFVAKVLTVRMDNSNSALA
ncbi:MAG: hypothetical protein CMQ14_08005 [Gammaproteobacteria bacterium]|nr:hypothetical protein [Gammaproteobacteria bacterium]